MRVLLAGTDERTGGIITNCLTSIGHELDVVSNGLGCISTLRDWLPGLLILDQSILWGGSDGVTAVMEADLELRNIPVLLVKDREVRQHYSAMPPIVGNVLKPFTSRDLLQLFKIIQNLQSAYAPSRNMQRRSYAKGNRIGAYFRD